MKALWFCDVCGKQCASAELQGLLSSVGSIASEGLEVGVSLKGFCGDFTIHTLAKFFWRAGSEILGSKLVDVFPIGVQCEIKKRIK